MKISKTPVDLFAVLAGRMLFEHFSARSLIRKLAIARERFDVF
jgi:hypothetical protein